MVRVQRITGYNPSYNPERTLLLPVQRAGNIRQAHLWSRTLRDHDSSASGPDLIQVRIAERPENDHFRH